MSNWSLDDELIWMTQLKLDLTVPTGSTGSTAVPTGSADLRS